MGNIWDDINPVKQYEDARRALENNDPSRAVRRLMPPDQAAMWGWKGDEATIPGIEVSPEQQAQMKYQDDKKKLADQMAARSREFRGQIPGYEQELYNQIEGQAKNSIAEKQREIKRLANRRGLLYSGLRQGSEASASAQIASKAASQKAKVAPELEQLAETLEQQAAKVAQANFADDLSLASQVYDRALAEARSRMEQLGQFGEVAGTVVGENFGSKNPESDRYEQQKREYSMSLNPDGTVSRSRY